MCTFTLTLWLITPVDVKYGGSTCNQPIDKKAQKPMMTMTMIVMRMIMLMPLMMMRRRRWWCYWWWWWGGGGGGGWRLVRICVPLFRPHSDKIWPDPLSSCPLHCHLHNVTIYITLPPTLHCHLHYIATYTKLPSTLHCHLHSVTIYITLPPT